MHIAICDNLVADRKHLERLLKREIDSKKRCLDYIYSDSYGDPSVLINSFMMYQLFIIDMAGGSLENYNIAKALREKGSTAVIAICAKDNLTQEQITSLEPFFYLEKPLKPLDISHLLDSGLAVVKAASRPLEIRGDKETFYVQEAEILYISGEKEFSIIHKTDGTSIRFLANIDDVSYSLEENPAFYIAKNLSIVNVNYISKVNFNHVILQDTIKIPISFLDRHYVRGQILEQRKKNS